MFVDAIAAIGGALGSAAGAAGSAIGSAAGTAGSALGLTGSGGLLTGIGDTAGSMLGGSAAPAAETASVGSQGILGKLGGAIGGGSGGGGGGDLQMIGKLLSKSKNSGMGSSTPADLSGMMQGGMKGYVDASQPGQDESPDVQGFMKQIMGMTNGK